MPDRDRAEEVQAPVAAKPVQAPEPMAPVLGGQTGGLTVPGVLNLQASAGNQATGRVMRTQLPGATAGRMSAAFGQDLSGVRVHPASPKATGATQALTEGRDVHFAPGRYAPGSQPGDRLIAHELAHVVQQSRAPAGSASGSALEADAERAAASAAAGERANVLLAAAPGRPQRFEGYEHQSLGNAYGGSDITVTTQTGVTLTYGDMVALSGDFARSPEQLMTMSAPELNALLEQIHGERTRADATLTPEQRQEQAGHGLDPMGSGGALAEGNIEYELRTRWYRQLEERGVYVPQERWDSAGGRGQHSHDEDEEEGHEGHEEHEGHGEHGPTDGTVAAGPGEHVEDPGPPGVNAEQPAADESFLNLASHNTSHFSPENISNNFKPAHREALRLAQQAWQARNPGRTAAPIPGADWEPSARTPGEGDAAYRERIQGELVTAPEDGANPQSARRGGPTPGNTGPAATDQSAAGPDATPVSADARSAGAGDAEAARALMMSAFGAHFLTDAFAGGHLVNGRAGRTAGAAYFTAHEEQIYGHLIDQIRAREGADPFWSFVEGQMLGRAFSSMMEPRGLAMRLLHDGLNERGVDVRNVRGTEWRTFGDNHLGNAPGTRVQAQLAMQSARDKVQQVLATGTCDAPFEALDFIPDVASMDGNTWLPILEFSANPVIFERLFREGFLEGDFMYKLVRGYIPAIKRVLWQEVKNLPGYALSFAGRQLGKAWNAVSGFVGGIVDRGREAVGGAIEAGRRVAGEVVDTGRQVVSEIGGFLGGLVDRGREMVDGAVETGREVVGGIRDTVSGAVERAGDAVQGARDAVEEGVSSVMSGLRGFFSRAVQTGREVVGGAIETGREVVGGAIETGREIVGGAIDRGRSLVESVRGGIRGGVERVKEFFRRRSEKPDQPVSALDPATQRYAHGGFMGAAGAMMQDSTWSAIYRILMPEHHAQAVALEDPAALMAHMENNPVLAAYGSVRHQQEVRGQAPGAAPDADHRAMTLEWDVWLPAEPAAVTDLNQVRIAHGGLVTTVGESVSPGFGRERSDVRDQPSGSEWMTLFGRAVAMARGGGAAAETPDGREEQLQRIAQTTYASQAATLTKEYLGQNGGLVLDIKSTYSRATDVAAFVEMLRAEGINVVSVGTFKFSQLALVDSERRTKFFHGLHDLENAIVRGREAPPGEQGEADGIIRGGDIVMFNAGALLHRPEGRYAVNQQAYQHLIAMQDEAHLRIGLYVQETAVAPEAVELINQLVSSRPDVFEMGFAYGNVSGRADARISGTGFGSQELADTAAGVVGP